MSAKWSAATDTNQALDESVSRKADLIVGECVGAIDELWEWRFF